jgi:hypothetical protein
VEAHRPRRRRDGPLVNNFNNFFLEFFRSGCQLVMSVKEIDEIVSRLSQCDKTEVLDDLLLKASVILDDGFLSWQMFVALQHQALLSSGFSTPPRARAPGF